MSIGEISTPLTEPHARRSTAVAAAIRWYVKKIARAAVVLLWWASGWSAVRRVGSTGPRIRVLTYHRFGIRAGDPFCVSGSEFEQQIAWIASRRLAISLTELREFFAGKRTVKDGSVLVTVDDGFHDFWSTALPILRRHAVPCVVFVPAADISASAGCPQGTAHDDRKLSTDELAALAQCGATIGSHSYHHRSLGAMDLDEVRYQAVESQRALERITGQPVVSFAYPFGTRADFNDDTRRVLRDCGYGCIFTSQHGAVTRAADAFELPRIKVEGGDGFWLFKLALRGALDPWALIDRVAWRVQQSGRWAY